MVCFATNKNMENSKFPNLFDCQLLEWTDTSWIFLIPGLGVYGIGYPKNPIVNHVDPHGFDQASDFLEGSAGKRPWKAWFRQLWKWGNHDLSRNGHSTSLNTIIEHLWKWGNTSLKIKLWGKGWKASFLKHLETIYQTKPQFFWFIDTCEHCPKPRDKRKQIPKHI